MELLRFGLTLGRFGLCLESWAVWFEVEFGLIWGSRWWFGLTLDSLDVLGKSTGEWTSNKEFKIWGDEFIKRQ